MNAKNKSKLVWKEMSFIEKCKHVKRNITVEPVLAGHIIASVLGALATQNLNLEKACRVNLNYEAHICNALTQRQTSNYTEEEKAVQTLVAGMQGWRSVLQSLMPCLLILFWGSWSDRHGRRKPCILIPVFGELITGIGLILCTYFENWPVEYAVVIESLFPGLAGGWCTMFMGIFSYIADITTDKERTLRIGIVHLCLLLGVPIGMAFSGILLKQIGFYGVFALSALLYLVTLTYGIFYLDEPNVKPPQLVVHKNFFTDFFDKQRVVETFEIVFRKGENQRRLKVIMLLVVLVVVGGPMYGEMSVIYLFTRFKFNWNEVDYSIFSTYSMLTSICGTFFSVTIFSHRLQINDTIIGVLSSMSKILSCFVYAFAANMWQFYLAPVAEMLNGTSLIALRSIVSKMVKSDELGKVNSLFAVVEALTPLIYAPLYTQVYQATIDYLPGAFFLLGGAMTAPAIAIFLWMYKLQKNDKACEKLPEKSKSVAVAGSNPEESSLMISQHE